jgi:hypothetical protein
MLVEAVGVGTVLVPEDVDAVAMVARFLLLLWMDSSAAFLPTLYNLIYIDIGIFVFNGGQSMGRVAHMGSVVDDIATVAAVDVVAADEDDFVDSC